MAAASQTFSGWGGRSYGTGLRARRRVTCVRAHTQASRQFRPDLPPSFRPVSSHSRQRFPAVAAVAKALQIFGIREQRPVALVVHDVVHVCRPRADAPPGAFPAERLPQQLGRPQLLGPYWLAVPAPPTLRRPAVSRLVGVAVARRCQYAAARMLTGPQWFVCQGYHLLR